MSTKYSSINRLKKSYHHEAVILYLHLDAGTLTSFPPLPHVGFSFLLLILLFAVLYMYAMYSNSLP